MPSRHIAFFCIGLLFSCVPTAEAQEVTPAGNTPDIDMFGNQVVEGPLLGSIAAFAIEDSPVELERLVQVNTYTDKTGRKFALLGNEAGWFEGWAWPLKLFKDLRLSFFVAESTTPISAKDIAQRIEVGPAVTTITYVYQSFTVQAHIITAIDEPGAVILLDVDATHPMSIVVGFIPTMQPMWPAGLGGQYARWEADEKAYLISEPTRLNHGYVGSPAGKGMSYTPAHMLGEDPNEYRIDIPDPASVTDRFIPIVMAGGKGERDGVLADYHTIANDPKGVYDRAKQHFDTLLSSTMSIDTPVDDLDLAFEWAKISYDNLMADNPDFEGVGQMAGLDRAGGGGRPGFGWFFGGDTYVNTLSLNAIGMHDVSRQALSFMTQFQREDGKMAHEVTQAWKYVDWFGDYPYAFIHADTSPWFIVAVHDHFAATGNKEFLAGEWEAIKQTYAWCLTTDINGDGMMDNEAAGLGALEFGAMTGILTDIYLGAIWTRALQVLPYLARQMGDEKLADDATRRYRKAAETYETFWSEETGKYAYAFDADGNTSPEVTPWASVGVMFGHGREERRMATMTRLSRSDMTTDWGVRMLSTESELFEPLNYNYGASWPFVTSWTTTAHFGAGRPWSGYSSLMSTVQDVYNRALGHNTEVNSGLRHTWPQESVPHQGFAIASTVLPTVRGLFGLYFDAASNRLFFSPQVPEDWDAYSFERFRYGDATFSARVKRESGKDTYTVNASKSTAVQFRPLYPFETRFVEVLVNGNPIQFEVGNGKAGVWLSFVLSVTGPVTVEVRHTEEPSIVPPVWESPIGAESRGLRIIEWTREGDQAQLLVEGRQGASYQLGFTNTRSVAEVNGASLSGDHLIIHMPTSDQEWVIRSITLRIEHGSR
jgi:hypothetical protein